MTRVDYLLVGAGAAGAAVAHRLSADPSVTVLLLEAGRRDISPLIHIPSGFTRLRTYSWLYRTVPQKAMDDATKLYPQGRTLGGGTAVNSMIYIRGQRHDFDDWAALGNPGWDYEHVLPYFRRAESYPRIDDAYHGQDGPLGIGRLPGYNPLSEAFVAAGLELGLPYNPDFNGATQHGVGYYDVTQHRGWRVTASTAYLRPVRRRPNLEVRLRATVTRVLVENGRAVGVVYRSGGREHVVRADREVVLCGGAVNSPALLLRSGIGPADELRGVGIDVRHDLPGVGRNLQDHLDVAVTSRTSAVSYNNLGRSWRLPGAAVEYMVRRSGPITSNVAEAGLFQSIDGDERPDLQMSALPTYGNGERRAGHGFTLNVTYLRPQSRGTVTLRSADPAVAPVVDPNYLAEPADWVGTRAGIAMARDILATRALRDLDVDELEPGPLVTDERGLRGYVNKRSRTSYHPVGTCAMGTGDEAVVDPQLRVRGLEGLRVVDSSIMPRLVSGNTMAASYMIGEKGSDLILGRAC